MADPPRHSDTGDEPGAGPDGGSIPGTPRWVKVFGLVALVVIVLFIVLMLIGGGEHGPGRHTPGAHAGPPYGVDHGEQQP